MKMENGELIIGIIEDEEDLLELIEFHLQNAGFDVVGFLNSNNVERFIEEENPALLIVDRNLPKVEGASFIKNLRKKRILTPVIFLTAKNSEEEILEGFEAGADDYITKPFSFKELLARVNAVLKRNHLQIQKINYKSHSLNLKEKSLDGIKLTNKEFEIVKLFFENQNKIITREELAEILEVSEKSVNVAINRINHKIDIFEPVRGIGYKLK